MKKRKKQVPVLEISANREKNTYGNIIWLLLLSGLFVVGSMLIILNSYGNQLPVSGSLLGVIVAFTLVICVLSTKLKEQYLWAGWLKIIPWIVVLIITGFHGYWNGVKLWINMLITRWNLANEGGISLLSGRADAHSAMAFFLFMAVACCEIAWILAEDNHVVYCCAFGMFWLILQFFGVMFRSLPCGLLLLGILGVWMSGTGRGNFRTSIRWMVFAGITLCICLAVEPTSDFQSVDDFRAAAKQTVKEIRYGKDTLPEGDLSKASELQSDNEEMLRVKSEQQKNIYFRGYVGGRYKDGVWEPLPDASYGGDNAGIMQWLKKRGFDPLTQVAAYYKISGENIAVENEVLVKVSGASRYYMYEPSSLDAINDKRVSEDEDMRQKSRRFLGTKEYAVVEYSEGRPAELIVPSSWVENPQSKAEKKYSEAEAVYRKFVYDNYLDVDENLRGVLDEYFWADYESESDGIYSAVSRVRKCLEEKTTYVESPRNSQAGEDPIKYFLLESGEGNAMDYASVAVEALRAHGIPARYVEGYYLPEGVARDENSGEIALTGQDTHAWAEVYFDGIGWLPIDVTPGYYYDAVELQQMVSAPDASKKNAALENNADNASDVTGDSQEGSGARREKIKKVARNITVLFIGAFAFILILLVCVIVAAELARIFCMQSFTRYMKHSTQRNRIRKYKNAIAYLLMLRGIKAQLGWETQATDEEVAKTYGEIEKGEYKRVCELLEKEIYGEIELEPYEERTIRGFFDKISEKRKSANLKEWLKFRYVYITLARC